MPHRFDHLDVGVRGSTGSLADCLNRYLMIGDVGVPYLHHGTAAAHARCSHLNNTAVCHGRTMHGMPSRFQPGSWPALIKLTHYQVLKPSPLIGSCLGQPLEIGDAKRELPTGTYRVDPSPAVTDLPLWFCSDRCTAPQMA
jgi:hypothetical protein